MSKEVKDYVQSIIAPQDNSSEPVNTVLIEFYDRYGKDCDITMDKKVNYSQSLAVCLALLDSLTETQRQRIINKLITEYNHS